jgi:hypothetical protein
MVHHMNDPFNASFDINFAICDFYYYPNIGLTNNNLFNTYWRRTVNQINRGKMLSAFFDLDEDDIQTLRLNDKIRIDNSWWNINKIQDYNANSRTLTKVELLSIDDELSLPIFRLPTKPDRKTGLDALTGVVLDFYRNNNVNLSDGSVVVKGIGNVVNEGLEGFVQGDYKVITTQGINGLSGGENFANTDLTLTGLRVHELALNFLVYLNGNTFFSNGNGNLTTPSVTIGADFNADIALQVENTAGANYAVKVTNGKTGIQAPTFADDAAAGTGGLVAGDIYKTATGELRIKL